MKEIKSKFKIKYGKSLKELEKDLGICMQTISLWDNNGFDIFERAKELHCLKGNKTLKRLWKNMKHRCGNPNDKRYKYYGGKGIKIKMKKSDLDFLWKRDKAYLMKKPSIDRKDSNGHYTLNNCRFIEMSLNSSRVQRPI